MSKTQSLKTLPVYIFVCKLKQVQHTWYNLGEGYNPPATNQTKISYPKPLKHSNKKKIRLNESKNNILIYFLVIKTYFNFSKGNIFNLCYTYNIRFLSNPLISFLCTRNFSTPSPSWNPVFALELKTYCCLLIKL